MLHKYLLNKEMKGDSGFWFEQLGGLWLPEAENTGRCRIWWEIRSVLNMLSLSVYETNI